MAKYETSDDNKQFLAALQGILDDCASAGLEVIGKKIKALFGEIGDDFISHEPDKPGYDLYKKLTQKFLSQEMQVGHIKAVIHALNLETVDSVPVPKILEQLASVVAKVIPKVPGEAIYPPGGTEISIRARAAMTNKVRSSGKSYTKLVQKCEDAAREWKPCIGDIPLRALNSVEFPEAYKNSAERLGAFVVGMLSEEHLQKNADILETCLKEPVFKDNQEQKFLVYVIDQIIATKVVTQALGVLNVFHGNNEIIKMVNVPPEVRYTAQLAYYMHLIKKSEESGEVVAEGMKNNRKSVLKYFSKLYRRNDLTAMSRLMKQSESEDAGDSLEMEQSEHVNETLKMIKTWQMQLEEVIGDNAFLRSYLSEPEQSDPGQSIENRFRTTLVIAQEGRSRENPNNYMRDNQDRLTYV